VISQDLQLSLQTMMNERERIAAALDLAVLKPTATAEDVKDACALANKHNIVSVCVPPCYVELAASIHPNVSTVIGFPHGNGTRQAKVVEAAKAIDHGAKELDMVVNYGRYLDGDRLTIGQELWALVGLDRDVPIKAILESCYYTPCQLLDAAKICVDYGVGWLKTSTGFGREGATPGAVEILLKAAEGTSVEVKASGGIKTYAAAKQYLDMGCTRVGSSSYSELLP
jgi:deoxyribose-phosphate aldolase